MPCIISYSVRASQIRKKVVFTKTKLEDLENDYRELVEARGQKQEELKAIEINIRMFGDLIRIMKKGSGKGIKNTQIPLISNDTISLREAMRREINDPLTGWVSAGKLSQILTEKGIGKQKEDKKWNAYRASISSALRKLAEKGEIQRYNKGTSKEPKFIYGSNQLGKYE
jgi:hypothetical protein